MDSETEVELIALIDKYSDECWAIQDSYGVILHRLLKELEEKFYIRKK